jgi:hypothetical protein
MVHMFSDHFIWCKNVPECPIRILSNWLDGGEAPFHGVSLQIAVNHIIRRNQSQIAVK